MTGVSVLLWFGAAPLLGQPQVFPAAPAPPPLGPLNDDEFRLSLEIAEAANVDRLIPLLGSPDYKQREAATTSLIDIGAPAFAKLRTAYEQSDDLEVRLRIEQVVRTAYLNRYVFDRNGFLGVQLGTIDPRDLKGKRRADIETGVKIGQVIANTAAAKAGLRADDIVIAMNGTPLSGTGREANDRFSDSIRQNLPGTKVRLSILRNDNPMTIDAVIGRCPEENVRRVRFAGLYDQVSERFETWWFKYFRGAATSDDAQP
jgi:C-terminal processing protease CtpA/Prc